VVTLACAAISPSQFLEEISEGDNFRSLGGINAPIKKIRHTAHKFTVSVNLLTHSFIKENLSYFRLEGESSIKFIVMGEKSGKVISDGMFIVTSQKRRKKIKAHK
jgi:hypothetical protein